MQVQRQCPVCGVTYEAESTRLKHGRQTTCSRVCSYRHRAAQLENSLAVICAGCGKEFKRPPSKVKGKHGATFCSPACHYAGRTAGLTRRIVTTPYNVTEEGRAAWVEGAKKTRQLRIERKNYGHTQATRAKLSEKTALAIAENRIPTRSKLEDKVAAELTRRGVAFTPQHPIRGTNGAFACVFDFLLPGGIALEVNGTFWHSDPRFFPNGPVHEIQKRNAAKWADKLRHAAQRNIRVIEVWEHDIKESVVEAVGRALGTAI